MTDNNTQSSQFPKTLLGFYIRYGARPYARILILWAITFIAMRVGYGVFGPLSERWFIQLFETTMFPGMNFVAFALPTILLIVGIILVCDILEVTSATLSGRWQPRIQNRISEVLNDYVHSQSMSYFTARMPGKINTQINYVSGGFRTLWDFLLMFAALIVVIVNMGLVLGINWKIAAILIGTLAFRVAYSWARVKPMNKASKDAADSSSTLSGKLIDSVSNFNIVKLFAGANFEKRHMEKPRTEQVGKRIYATYMQRWFWALPSIVYTLLMGVIYYLCVVLFVSGEMKISEIVFTISVYFSVLSAISNIVQRIPDVVDVIGSAQKSYEEMVKPIDVRDAPDAPALRVPRGSVELRSVSFKYKRKNVLDNFSLNIKPGEKVGLVGSSGAGKTTLVNLLMRFYDPTKGAIFIDGQGIREVTQDSLRENIAFIPQEPTMFNRTLKENIGYGRADASDKEIHNAAKKAQADKFIMDTEKKYDSLVGDRGIKLSGGQRQRIAIARAFLKDAPILILDEATSALDSETEAAIQKSFEELSHGRTTIAIAHRLSTLRHMDRIVVMEDGHIAEQGTHQQLLRKKGGIYARLWKMQSGGFLQN
ncbi:MAG: ABC transporter ATP-binding protein/permease [Alphaproteobacteria bacterium]|nr:ABC transporter ATP-binding protein/permease [Alphaproteobacteria bacterium]